MCLVASGGLISVFMLIGFASYAQLRYTNKHFSSRSEVLGKHGMIATSHPLATQVGLDILKRGGSAMDAAIAANCMLGLVEPTGNGIGGDLFAIVWEEKSQRLYGLNGSGRSPKGMDLQYLLNSGHKKIPSYGALSVSVPGCVDAWYTLHQRFGILRINDLFKPTIDYAIEGFPVTEVIAFLWQEYAATLRKYTGFRNTYMPGGLPPCKGQLFQNPDLANTLKQLVKHGRDGFYKGIIADSITESVKREGGFLSKADLAEHRSEWVEPVSTNYRGYDVWELPPNSQGLAVLEMLNILERYDIRKMGFGSADYIHHFLETKKLVFEDRAFYYADPAFYKAPMAGLLSKSYAARRSKLLDPVVAGNFKAGEPSQFGNTIYLTVADRFGNLVSLIQSNFAGMGSGIVPGGTGFSLQNRGCSFDLTPGKPNSYAPGKRPFQTLIPGFLTKNGRPFLSFGVMGADMQPLGQVQVIVNLVDFGMNLQEAADAPRINHVGSSDPTGEPARGKGIVYLEAGFSPLAISELQKRGHIIGMDLRGYGGFQGIIKDSTNGIYHGASEFRKDGNAAGY